MRTRRVTFAAAVAVVAFAAAVAAARVAEREHCLAAVRRTPVEGSAAAQVGGAIEALAPGGSWRVVRAPDGGREARYEAGGETWAWHCTPEAIPLVEAVSPAARAMTPSRVAP